MFRYTYNTLVYGKEPVEVGIERLAKLGYDGVELVGEPGQYDEDSIHRALEKNGLVASSIVSIFTPDRDIVSSSPVTRSAAVTYVRGNIDYAARLGANVVTFTPTACMKITPDAPLDREWAWAVEAATVLARYAGDAGVQLVLEPWNRYETYLVNRTEQALRFLNEVDSASMGYMADTFHMSIEEQDVAGSIRKAGSRLAHIHLADTNRAAPGYGHLDFEPIVQAMIDIDYGGWVSYELLPAAGDVWGVLSGRGAPEFKDLYSAAAIQHTKALERRLRR